MVVPVLGFFSQGRNIAQFGRVGFTIDVDDVEVTCALFHVVGKVIYRSQQQLDFLHLGGEFLQGGGNLVICIGFFAVDVGNALGDIDGIQFSLMSGSGEEWSPLAALIAPQKEWPMNLFGYITRSIKHRTNLTG